ncbi:MAG: hypothetical protein HOP33_21675 [Verrucomicrobia bacterium]|nr:hypothetical protein [Verrucomicrobiota bacterium]
MNVRQILHDKKVRGLSILLRDGSEIAAFKASGFLSVGVSLCGKELRAENEVFRLLQTHGGIVMEYTKKFRLKGKVRRAALLRFGKRSGFLAAISALGKSNKERRLIVRPVQPSLIWKAETGPETGPE